MKLYKVILHRLTRMSDSKHSWKKVFPICVYGQNKSEAVRNAIWSIDIQNGFPIRKLNGDPVVYVLDDENHNSCQKEHKFYVFWVVGQMHHVVIQAKSKDEAKTLLCKKDMLIYSGKKIEVCLAKDCSGSDCPWFKDACEARQKLSSGLSNTKERIQSPIVQETTEIRFIKCPLCGEENPDTRTDCWECSTSLKEGSPVLQSAK